MVICERCGTESPSGLRFCGACGAALPGSDAERGTRKLVTSLFCDIAGSTALGERLDPEVLRNVINQYFERITAIIERHGGTVQKFAGDAVMAVFGVPRVHEDDALRAIRAAAEIHQQVPAIAQQVGVALQFRTGVNTGLVLTDETKSLAIGDAVNVAARLEQAAQPDQVLLGSETLRLVRDAVEVEPLEPLVLKGKTDPVPAFRLLSVDPIAPGLARRQDIKLVGREAELRQLRTTWERSVAEPGCHRVTLVGPAGVGKSRLAAELLAEVEPVAVTLTGRCLPYGDGITFWPVIEALTALGEEGVPLREHLSSGGVATPEELFLELRELLESIARRCPLILNVEDLQWAEPMLLDLLDHIVELSRGAPVLVLCTARPELLEDRPDWGEARRGATTVRLEPLADSACGQLLAELGQGLDPDQRERVIQSSEGNPLFLQEMAVLAGESDDVVVPTTIQSLLAARLERLAADERELLEHGSIEGQVFHSSAIRALVASADSVDIDSGLAKLVRKDLIRPHHAGVEGDAFSFRHLLIRDAAYERLPKATRAELHERFVRWLQTRASEHAELDEIAGWHAEQAVQYARELRRDDDPALVRSAAAHLYAAGRRAGQRSDAQAASSLLERALALVGDTDPQHRAIAVELAERLIESGDLARADELLSATGDQGPEGAVSLNRLEWLVLARPEEAAETLAALLPGMLIELRQKGDDRGLAKAYMLSFWSHWAANRATRAGAEVRQAAEHAGRCGDHGLRARALTWYVATLIWGPRNVSDIARELDEIQSEQPGPYLAATVAVGRSEVARLQRRSDDARDLAQRAYDAFMALGIRPMAAGSAQALARAQLSDGELEAARATLEQCDAVLSEFDERPQRSTIQAMLARVCELLGAQADARAAVEMAEQLSAPGDAINYAMTHGVRARLALADGTLEHAERWAKSALQYALLTDFPTLHAETRLIVAEILRAQGRDAEAAGETLDARRAFTEKGDRPGEASADGLLAELGASA